MTIYDIELRSDKILYESDTHLPSDLLAQVSKTYCCINQHLVSCSIYPPKETNQNDVFK